MRTYLCISISSSTQIHIECSIPKMRTNVNPSTKIESTMSKTKIWPIYYVHQQMITIPCPSTKIELTTCYRVKIRTLKKEKRRQNTKNEIIHRRCKTSFRSGSGETVPPQAGPTSYERESAFWGRSLEPQATPSPKGRSQELRARPSRLRTVPRAITETQHIQQVTRATSETQLMQQVTRAMSETLPL